MILLTEIGQFYTRAGLKSENLPVKLFRTYQHIVYEPIPENLASCVPKSKVLQNLDDTKAYHLVHEYLDYLFTQVLYPQVTTPGIGTASVYIFINMLSSRRFTSLLEQVITEQYNPASLQIVPTNLTPFYLSGFFSGVHLDVGFTQTEVLSVVEGIPIKQSLDYLPVGGLKLLSKCKQEYLQSPVLSNTLKELFETNLDMLADICVSLSVSFPRITPARP